MAVGTSLCSIHGHPLPQKHGTIESLCNMDVQCKMENNIWALEKEEIVEHVCEIHEQDPIGLARGGVRYIAAS